MRKPRRSSPHVNLLPLLDVLLCTMGTLIVVLGFLNRGDSAPDVSKGRFSFSATRDEADEELDETTIIQQQLQLRIDQISQAREKTTAELEEARRRLSAIEDHSRRITKQIEDLQAAAKQLPGADGTATAERDAIRSELMRLNTEKMRLAADLNKARDDARFRKPAFAVIPYDGLHKTHRRPIYIECRANSIVLQPEGIVFTEMDFLGPNGPGNPLASALRAAREYWNRQPPPSADERNEPYPLLLVRPDGITAYAVARNALLSWDSEFGYELIDADWKLDFPLPPQAQLKEMEERAVADARQRLAWLAETSPERFTRKQTGQGKYRLAPGGGGLVRSDGMNLGKNPFANDPLGGFGRSPVSGYGGESRGDRYGFGSGGNSLDPSGQGGSGKYLAGSPNGTSPNSSGSSGSGLGLDSTPGSGTGFGGGLGLDSPRASGTGQFGGSGGDRVFGGQGGADNGILGGGDKPGDLASGRAGMNGAGTGNPGGAQGGPMQSNVGQRYAGASGGGTSGGTQPSNGSSGTAGVAGQTASSGDSSASPNGSQSGSPGGTSSGASSGSPSSGGSMGQSSGSGQPSTSGGMPTPSLEYNASQPSQRTASRSMADMRGGNWALPSESQASIPITRPIRLECWPDRIVIMSDSRDQQPQVIPLKERTEESIDKVVGAVRDHSKRWGIAGRGMYWRPQLVLQVNPNGDARADDLQVLLANSGLDIKRK